MSRRHLHGVDWRPSTRRPPALDQWPFDVPAIAQLIDEGGFELPPGVTFLVGENGSGKSTLLAGLAATYPRRGAEVEVGVESPLQWHLDARTDPLASPDGLYVSAARLPGLLARLEAGGSPAERRYAGERFSELSHGESVLLLLRSHFVSAGVYFLDEPETALSFTSTLGLLSVLDDLARGGCQVVAATHSPILTALPGATIVEIDDDGFRRTAWGELAVVESWRSFLTEPARILRHLVPEDGPPSP